MTYCINTILENDLLFVTHSLGGLLAKQILRTADGAEIQKRAVLQNARGIIFLATPHSGADLATFLNRFPQIFGATVSIENLRADDPHLRDLYEWYRTSAASASIHTLTYFEMREVAGLAIVRPMSANPGTGSRPVPLDEDHLSIAKPRSRTAQIYCALCALIRNHALAGRQTNPELQTDRSASLILPTPGQSSVQNFYTNISVYQSIGDQQSQKEQHFSPTVSGPGLAIGNISIANNAIPQRDGIKSIEVPNKDVLTIMKLYDEKAKDFEQRIEEGLDLDFPAAVVAASKAEAWIADNISLIPKDTADALYRQLARVEIVKVSRNLPMADIEKASTFLKLARP